MVTMGDSARMMMKTTVVGSDHPQMSFRMRVPHTDGRPFQCHSRSLGYVCRKAKFTKCHVFEDPKRRGRVELDDLDRVEDKARESVFSLGGDEEGHPQNPPPLVRSLSNDTATHVDFVNDNLVEDMKQGDCTNEWNRLLDGCQFVHVDATRSLCVDDFLTA